MINENLSIKYLKTFNIHIENIPEKLKTININTQYIRPHPDPKSKKLLNTNEQDNKYIFAFNFNLDSNIDIDIIKLYNENLLKYFIYNNNIEDIIINIKNNYFVLDYIEKFLSLFKDNINYQKILKNISINYAKNSIINYYILMFKLKDVDNITDIIDITEFNNTN